MDRDHRFETWWLVDTDGTAWSYGEGGIAVLERIPLTRAVGRVLRLTRTARLLTALDLVVARHRHKLGYLVPKVGPPRRFP